MRRAPVVLVGLAAILAGAAARADPFPGDDEVHALLLRHLAEAGGSGAVVVALVDGDGTRFLSAGKSGNPARPQADEDTLFQVGSVTKTFTAYLLAEAVRRGEVKLDDRLDRTIGDRTGTREDGAGSATLIELATHTAGLPRVPTDIFLFRSIFRNPRDPYFGYSEADLDLSLARLRRGRWRTFAYSNLGFALLGKALEHASGKPYADLVRERVTGPLGLDATFVDVPASHRDRMAAGYDPMGKPTPAWHLGAFAGAGAIWSSARDLVRYAEAVRKDTGEPSLLRARAPRDRGRVGLAWVVEGKDDDVVWHNGGTGGFRSFVGFRRSSGVAVVALTSTEEDVTDLGHHLLDPTYPLRKRSHVVIKLLAAAMVLFMVVRYARVGRPAKGRLGRLLTGGSSQGRADAAAGVLGAIAVIALGWYVIPWSYVGGAVARIVFTTALPVAAIAGLWGARPLPWFATEGLWPRARVVLRTALCLAMLLLALRLG